MLSYEAKLIWCGVVIGVAAAAFLSSLRETAEVITEQRVNELERAHAFTLRRIEARIAQMQQPQPS